MPSWRVMTFNGQIGKCMEEWLERARDPINKAISLTDYEDSMLTPQELNEKPLKELLALRDEIRKAKNTFEQRNMLKAAAAAEEAVKPFGVTLAELVNYYNGFDARGTKTKSIIRFRNPNNPLEAWTGTRPASEMVPAMSRRGHVERRPVSLTGDGQGVQAPFPLAAVL